MSSYEHSKRPYSTSEQTIQDQCSVIAAELMMFDASTERGERIFDSTSLENPLLADNIIERTMTHSPSYCSYVFPGGIQRKYCRWPQKDGSDVGLVANILHFDGKPSESEIWALPDFSYNSALENDELEAAKIDQIPHSWRESVLIGSLTLEEVRLFMECHTQLVQQPQASETSDELDKTRLQYVQHLLQALNNEKDDIFLHNAREKYVYELQALLAKTGATDKFILPLLHSEASQRLELLIDGEQERRRFLKRVQLRVSAASVITGAISGHLVGNVVSAYQSIETRVTSELVNNYTLNGFASGLAVAAICGVLFARKKEALYKHGLRTGSNQEQDTHVQLINEANEYLKLSNVVSPFGRKHIS